MSGHATAKPQPVMTWNDAINSAKRGVLSSRGEFFIQASALKVLLLQDGSRRFRIKRASPVSETAAPSSPVPFSSCQGVTAQQTRWWEFARGSTRLHHCFAPRRLRIAARGPRQASGRDGGASRDDPFRPRRRAHHSGEHIAVAESTPIEASTYAPPNQRSTTWASPRSAQRCRGGSTGSRGAVIKERRRACR